MTKIPSEFEGTEERSVREFDSDFQRADLKEVARKRQQLKSQQQVSRANQNKHTKSVYSRDRDSKLEEGLMISKKKIMQPIPSTVLNSSGSAQNDRQKLNGKKKSIM